MKSNGGVALLKAKEEGFPVIAKRKQIPEAAVGRVYSVLIDLVRPNTDQPRKIFDQEELKETAGSLQGDVEEPIRVVIRNSQSGFFFLIIDGERRWRSAKIAGLEMISCLVCKDRSDDLVYLSSAKANCDRVPFNPLEIAGIAVEFNKRFGWNHTRVAQELGKSQGFISNCVKYLALCASLREKLMKNQIDKAVALNLASFPAEKQEELNDRFEKETGGEKISPRDIPRKMKKVAQEMRIVPRPSKKGKRHATHPDLTVSNLTRAIAGLEAAMKEFNALTDEDIVSQASCHIIDLITQVSNCRERIGALAERINILD